MSDLKERQLNLMMESYDRRLLEAQELNRTIARLTAELATAKQKIRDDAAAAVRVAEERDGLASIITWSLHEARCVHEAIVEGRSPMDRLGLWLTVDPQGKATAILAARDARVKAEGRAEGLKEAGKKFRQWGDLRVADELDRMCATEKETPDA